MAGASAAIVHAVWISDCRGLPNVDVNRPDDDAKTDAYSRPPPTGHRRYPSHSTFHPMLSSSILSPVSDDSDSRWCGKIRYSKPARRCK